MKTKQLRALSEREINHIIGMAWADRVSFEEIKEKTGLSEIEVITVMRENLKRNSFNRWRKRVGGRTTKHLKRFRADRKKMKQHT